MNNTIRKKAFHPRRENGATMVEFAIILPLFIILIFGIIEFGLLLYNKGIITHAAREGARAGVIYDAISRITINEIETEVNKYIQNNLVSFSPSTPDIDVNSPCPPGTASGQELIVNISYNYSFLVLPNFVAALAGGTNLESEAVMICE
jgi:Flp pilus assembly protein TadG